MTETIGRYRVERRLGEGGMGVVWAALAEDGTPVAIKLVRSEATGEGGARRLLREARAASAITHPNVVRVLEVTEVDGAPAIVLERLDGETLAQRLARDRVLPPAETAAVLREIAAGADAAHALGVIHRDLKPENVFLCEGGGVKILDFGIAKLTAIDGDAARTAQTKTGELIGTPAYMAPEQIFGEPDLDARVDVWALGLIGYRCLTGILPTEAENVGQALKRILTRVIPPVRELAPDAPEELAAAIERMLARERADRVGSMREVRDLLDAARPRWWVSAARAVRKKLARRRRALVVAGVLAAVAVTAVAVSFALAARRSPAADPCVGFAAELDGVWDAHVRAGVVGALGKLTAPRAAEIADRTAGLLDRRAEAWTAARTGVCRAAAHRELPTDAALARVDCLERKRDEIASLAHLLAAPDASMLSHALAAADETGRVGECQRALAGHDDGDLADPRVAAARHQVDAALMLRRLGRLSEAIAALRPAADAALEAGARSTAANALLELALAQSASSPDDAAATIQRATQVAGEARDDGALARCQLIAMYVTGVVQSHTAEGLAQRTAAEAAVARAGTSLDLEFDLHLYLGYMLAAADRADDARREFQAALAAEDANPDSTIAARVSVLNALGNNAESRGDYDAAVAMFERTAQAIEERDGSDSALMAYPLNSLGAIAVRRGRDAEALADYQRALALFEANLPPNSAAIGVIVGNVAMELEAVGRHDEARAAYQRALAIIEATAAPESEAAARTHLNLADASTNAHDVPGARAELTRAVAIARKLTPDHPLLVTALSNLAVLDTDAGDPRAGATSATEAVAICERRDHCTKPMAIYPLVALGRALFAAKQPHAAVAPLERALAITDIDPLPRGQARLTLAEASWDSGGDHARALGLGRDALALFTEAKDADWQAKAHTWLDAHPR